uniref:Peptidyl-prolyl cis-trans isomerase n=1 Tax=Lotharella oceanica TaxID=641309 RepID=A0A7S2TXN3_9EUKA
MTYEGTRFFKIIPNFVIQGGDFLNGDGTGVGSMYGPTFKDENFRIKHREAGIVTMANAGRDTNANQFMITLQPSSWLDMKHVAFGKVTEGLEVLAKIADYGTPNGEPAADVVISECGIVPQIDIF